MTRKSWLKVFLLLAPLLLLAAAELVVRVVPASARQARGSRAEFLVNDEIAHEGEYERDPTLFWRMVKNGRVSGYVRGGVRTNALGLRGADPPIPKPADTYRIVGLGDSCVFGLGIAEDAAVYGAVFAQELAPSLAPRRVEWVNAGVSGYSSLQGLRLLERLGPTLQPDLVLACFGLNDYLYAAAAADAELRIAPAWLLAVQNALQHSALFRWIAGRFSGDPPRSSHVASVPPRRVGPDEFRDNLRAIVRTARGLGAEVMLLTMAVRPEIPLVLNPVFLPEAGGYRRLFGVWVGDQAAYRMREWPGTEAELRAAIGAAPELPLPHYFVGLMLARAGDPRAAAELEQARSLDRDRAIVAQYNAIVADVAAAEQVPLCDQAALFRAAVTEDLFDDERHLNAAGHRIVGEALAERWRALPRPR
jgi:lysophospholipase L1-like esterase